MTDPAEIKNVTASVRQRLKNWANAHNAVFDLVLQRYAAERFLYRLGVSSEVDRFTLKGAALFLVWAGVEFRATRDVDLLGTGAEDHAAIRKAMATICAIEDPRDGLAFDPATIRVDNIRHDEGYGGVRVKLEARLGNARIRLQVDIGFGDAIHPGREEADYPTLLDLATPRVWAYPRETVIAEKFEAMVSLGSGNSRMKDFWDVAALSQEFEFDGETLRTAIDETFRRRGTPIGEVVPGALRPVFYQDDGRAEMWRAFRQKPGLQLEVPAAFAAVGERVIAFLGPVRGSLARDESFARTWPKEGPWQTGYGQGGYGGSPATKETNND
jgi:hypothetical protein